ncbi:MAG: hypothetical protein ACE5DM_04990 [Candidatus Nanoarchaeia archaeon]
MAFYHGMAQFMVDVGFMDVVLPFMFIFTILFAILQKSKVLGSRNGRPKSNFNAMFAFVVSFFFIASLARVQLLTYIVTRLAVVIVAIICFLLITGMFSGSEGSFLKYKWLMAFLFIIVLWIFGTGLGWISFDDLGILGEWLFHPVTVLAVVFILILYLIIREPSKAGEAKPAEKKEKEPKEKKGGDKKGGEKPPSEPPLYEPQLERSIPREELYGDKEGDVLWKE